MRVLAGTFLLTGTLLALCSVNLTLGVPFQDGLSVTVPRAFRILGEIRFKVVLQFLDVLKTDRFSYRPDTLVE